MSSSKDHGSAKPSESGGTSSSGAAPGVAVGSAPSSSLQAQIEAAVQEALAKALPSTISTPGEWIVCVEFGALGLYVRPAHGRARLDSGAFPVTAGG